MEKTITKKPTYFLYQARGNDGKLYESKVQAPNVDSVMQGLVDRGYTPLHVEEVSNSGLNAEINLFGEKRVKLAEIAQWARQLSVMIDAGLPVMRALSILERQASNSSMKKALHAAKRDVETGSSLADALEPHSKIFSDLTVSMIRAGEEGGFLDKALQRVAVSLEKEVALRSKIKSAMMYPIVVLVMAILAVIGMLIFIVPIFQDFFASAGGTLPLPTRILVGASTFMKIGIIPLVALAVIGWFWWKNNKNAEYVRNFVDPLKLRIPVFGKLVQKIVMSRFTRNTSTLIASGVDIIKTFDVVAATTGSIVVSNAIEDVKASVVQGNTISEPMSQHDVFPTMVTEMIAVGEEVGNIDFMMEKIADFYDQQIESETAALASLIEPLMIAFLGVVIGSMVIALYLPIFNMYDLIR